MKYFFDTYALVEIIKENPSYEPFLDEEIVTSILNLGEFYYAMTRDFGKQTANQLLARFEPYGIQVSLPEIATGMAFRFEHRKLGLSFIDCVGYILAKNNGLVFLTGDKGFKDLPNVRYVK